MTARTPAEIVGSKLEKLYVEQRSLEEQRSRLAERGRLLQIQIDLLEGLKTEMDSALDPAADAEEPTEKPAQIHEIPASLRQGPTDAVLTLLATHPQGLPKSEIVERLANVIHSSSADKKRVLYNTLINLKNRGLVRTGKDAFGREVVIPDSGEAA